MVSVFEVAWELAGLLGRCQERAVSSNLLWALPAALDSQERRTVLNTEAPDFIPS